jgi:hypothetical protein
VALTLYDKFFSRWAMPFGFEDYLLDRNPMRKFEEMLRKSRCDGMSSPNACYKSAAFSYMETNDNAESAIKEWRVATVRACMLLDRNSTEYAIEISRQIWTETLHQFCHRKAYSKRDAARTDLDNLCKRAADLAILFRGSTIEYEWEQDTSHLGSLEVIPKDHEIVGTKGPMPNEESGFEIAFIVFGGVVRGDKGTGLLENGRIRLSKTQVVIRSRKSES